MADGEGGDRRYHRYWTDTRTGTTYELQVLPGAAFGSREPGDAPPLPGPGQLEFREVGGTDRYRAQLGPHVAPYVRVGARFRVETMAAPLTVTTGAGPGYFRPLVTAGWPVQP